MNRTFAPPGLFITDPAAFRRHREIAASFQNSSILQQCSAVARSIDSRRLERQEIKVALHDYAVQHGSPAESLQNIHRMQDASAVFVVTGQQPGFCGGPLYTFYKAAHCVTLAAHLEQHFARPVIPVFWNHSDDHDIDETRGITLLDGDAEPHRVTLNLGQGRPALADIVVSSAAAAEAWESVASWLPGASPDSVFAPQTGGRFASATSRILLHFLGRHGLVVFEPRVLRPLMSKSLSEIVENLPSQLPKLASVAARMRADGLTPPFDEVDPSIIYEHAQTGRLRIHLREGLFELPTGERITVQELSTRILKNPQLYTPGVATRLLCEAAALPVIAVIRGPAELAYAPCSRALHASDYLLPVEVPRFSATLIEPKVMKWIRAAGLTPAEAVDPSLADRATAAESHAVLLQIDSLQKMVARALRDLTTPVRELDVNLERPLAKTTDSVAGSIEYFRGRVARSLDERNALGSARIRKISNSLRPFGKPQERSVPLLPFVIHEPEAFINSILPLIDPVPLEHSIIEL